MLLRWLVNQYLRDTAEGKLREVVSGIAPERSEPVTERAPRQEIRPAVVSNDSEQPSAPDFLPCHAAFIFALGIESGGLVDLLASSETSRHGHGVERAG